MRLMLVDGNHSLHRHLHIESLAALEYDGVKTGGAFGTLKSLSVSMEKFTPTCVVFVWDGGRSARRQRTFPEYKPRPTKDPEYQNYRQTFGQQQVVIDQMLHPLGVRTLSIPGHEADDVIGWIVHHNHIFGADEIVIVSDDMDLAQLVLHRGIKLWRPVQRKEVTELNFKESCGVDHRYYVMLKAVQGDGSDGIPGVRGVGYTTFCTALELLELEAATMAADAGLRASEYDAIPLDETLLDRWKQALASHKSSRVRKMANGWDIFRRNMALMDIRVEFEDFTEGHKVAIETVFQRGRSQLDEQRVMMMLHKLGFKSILAKWSSFIHPFRFLSAYDASGS